MRDAVTGSEAIDLARDRPDGVAANARRAFMLRVLTVGLGIFTVVHNAIVGTSELLSHKNLTVAVALIAILRPGRWTLLALLAADLVSASIAYPNVYNHSVILGIVAIIVIGYCGWHAIRGNRGALEEGPLYAAMAPGVRLTVITAYAFAAFAKLNSGFFEGDTSCAVRIYNDVVDNVAILPRSAVLHRPLMYGTLAVEIAIPILLAFRRTRLAALALGMAFHLVLVTAGHSPFTTAAIAFYMGLFLPEDMVDRLRALGRRRPALAALVNSSRRLLTSKWTLAAALAVWVPVSITSVTDPSGRRSPRVIDAIAPSVLLYGALVVVVAVAALGPGSGPRIAPHALRLTHRGWLVGPSLIAIVALSPYVGLKTTASLTMYSNLRTEGDRWNHLVLPEAMQVFGFQDDLVTIIRTDDPKLAEVARTGDRMVWFSFAEHRRNNPDHDVELERDGRGLRLERGEGLGDLATPPHTLAKVMSFRTVSVTGRCQH